MLFVIFDRLFALGLFFGIAISRISLFKFVNVALYCIVVALNMRELGGGGGHSRCSLKPFMRQRSFNLIK